ncbi:hypothetical protein [Neisseria meningitidis]|nr:hypothetical protein [Neisseria meningitidis]
MPSSRTVFFSAEGVISVSVKRRTVDKYSGLTKIRTRRRSRRQYR